MGRTFFLRHGTLKLSFLRTLPHFAGRCISCRGSKNERMACGFAMRVVAWGILSRPNTPIRQRSDSRALISLFMSFLASNYTSAGMSAWSIRSTRQVPIASRGCSYPSPRPFQHLRHKKESTDFNSTRKSIGACKHGGGLTPYTTHRHSSSKPPFGLLNVPYRRTAFLEWDPLVTNLHRIG